ncbi:sigma-70 family RNA polymerase sigma factor [Clostridium lacusfryxellense]|uniref:sigma-70 family RNA polymerase sigma factor n=1 Tax=Clostridium lacusfryxellense TaxID=205328 RepID=UPI001C0C72B9|nr:sigma-70 family RNA polymerase sigma factor [Clostridium lacusfryxellense]MBU3114456.1 sigma-70 family RNA polymerase sigma factor [Clostridium lacusfryxellense]
MINKLVRRLKERDESAVDDLYDLYFNRIYYYVKRIIGNYGTKEDNEECVSDVFLALWKEIYKFDAERGSFDTFINVKTKTVALNFRRKLQSHTQKHLNTSIDNVDLSTSVEEEVSDIIFENEFLDIINKFKEPDKTYFHLRYFMNYGIKEIAKSFNTTVSSVDNRLYRCRLSLKKIRCKEIV